MIHEESSAPNAQPSTEEPSRHDQDERPHACIDGWVYLGRMVKSEHDLDGEVEVIEAVRCRRCADSRADSAGA